ncbi:hypothetical protein CAK95_26330 [Pseudorhodoplanes sinuspersici]|uniref:Uncharacterized protein n=1 Tax=Pseudorhodoplanes sinuspersici TaxID=1235591 RepID=A0A1W6ZY42_9HYPH|nr:hypothetical protein CAK95_26330 [Pseudorhodoplanes sinuspersici]
MKQHALYGFLCAACGRCLEELPAWQLGKERFYCGVICKEADEFAQAPARPDPVAEPRRKAS